jgi:hypothetical protein
MKQHGGPHGETSVLIASGPCQKQVSLHTIQRSLSGCYYPTAFFVVLSDSLICATADPRGGSGVVRALTMPHV